MAAAAAPPAEVLTALEDAAEGRNVRQ